MERISNYNPAKGDVQCLDMWTEPNDIHPTLSCFRKIFIERKAGYRSHSLKKMQSRAAEGVAKQHLGNQQSPYRKAGRVPNIHL